MPFARELGIELDHAEGHPPLADWQSSVPWTMVAHGGVADGLADTAGGAAVISANGAATPTIDMRINYLAPATGEALHAVADVVRMGDSVATVDVTATDETGERISEARGVYKTGGGDGDSPRTSGIDRRETGQESGR
jgi:uncharacterized protein (TIGR00369 family)